MNYGVALRTWDTAGDLGRPQALVELARLAESLGYDSVWASDHVAVPVYDIPRIGERWMDPLVLLAFLAARTERIRLGTDVLVLPYRHPLFVAKAAAALDRLSGGRLILGVGTGYIEPEFRAVGVPFESRGARMDEHLRALRQIWAGTGPVSFQGRFVQFSDMFVEPRPVQRPHPPIWVAGGVYGVAPRVVRRAVELADGLHVFQPTLEQLDNVLQHLDTATREAGRARLPHVSMSFRPVQVDYNDRSRRVRPSGERKLLSGTVREARADIEALRRRGVRHLVLRFAAGDDGYRGVVRAMERFAREVGTGD